MSLVLNYTHKLKSGKKPNEISLNPSLNPPLNPPSFLPPSLPPSLPQCKCSDVIVCDQRETLNRGLMLRT